MKLTSSKLEPTCHDTLSHADDLVQRVAALVAAFVAMVLVLAALFIEPPWATHSPGK